MAACTGQRTSAAEARRGFRRRPEASTGSRADAGLEAARLINDGIAKIAAHDPERLLGMGTLPMQNPDAAVAELERVVRQHGARAQGRAL
jgi:aminocarboxymuconate-semialdehyde decarboxylase